MTADWIAEQRRVYFGNANSVKDYRIQLRSTKTVWYWSLYLGILVLVALANYGSITQQTQFGGPAAVQAALTGYYQMVVGFVHAGILIIAPMIAASSVVSEYELRSIELVQCSPTTAKYLFVGKFIACLRQILLLLFLALPIAAVGVTLGGATWRQILEQFGYIAMQGSMAAALAFPIAIATKSILRTVGGVAGSIFLFTMVGMALGTSMVATTGMSTVPPFAGIIPFASALAVGQSFDFFGVAIPHWLTALALTGLIIKVLLLGAGSALTRVGSAETVSLRIHGLFLTLLFAGAVFLLIRSSVAMAATGSSQLVETTFMWMGFPMFAVFVVGLAVAAHGRMEERKFFADRMFVPADTFRGRPSGALGYIGLTTAIVTILPAIAVTLNGSFPATAIAAAAAWNFAFAFMVFGTVWWVSTFFDSAVGARRMSFGAVFGVGAVLHFLGAAIDASLQNYQMTNMLGLNIFLPFGTNEGMILAKAAALVILGAVLLIAGERRRASNLNILRHNGYIVDRDELTAQTT